MSRGPWIDHFGDNFLWSNATLILKGMAPYGVVALEEIDRVCERLRPRWGQDSAWQEEWRWMGRMVEERAEAALAEGHKLTAANYFLRAGIYHYNAERFILPSPEKRAQSAIAYKCWHTGMSNASAMWATLSQGVTPPIRAASACTIEQAPFAIYSRKCRIE